MTDCHTIAAEIHRAAFTKPRSPRSVPYKQGVLAALNRKLCGEPVHCHYPDGSAESDAFFAGIDEGNHLAADHMAKAREIK